MSLRSRAAVTRLVEARAFQRSIIALILVNAVVLGLETSPELMSRFGGVLEAVNDIVVGVFVVEILLRIYAHRGAFFRDGWSLFDLAVVLVALIPASGGAEVLRILRLLRVLRLLSAVRSMRLVVSALGAAIPGILSIGGLLVMILYVFAVSSTTLFADLAPEAFGDLVRSTTSLFRLMVADGWGDLVVPLAAEHGWAWGYFITFMVVSTFVVLNLFVAVTVEAMNRKRAEHDEGARGAPATPGALGHLGTRDGPGRLGTGDGSGAVAAHEAGEDRVLAELLALRAQVDRLEERLGATESS